MFTTNPYLLLLGLSLLLVMPGSGAIGVTLNSGVENCSFFEPPPLFRFRIGVVGIPPGIDLFSGSNSMVSAPPPFELIAMLSKYQTPFSRQNHQLLHPAIAIFLIFQIFRALAKLNQHFCNWQNFLKKKAEEKLKQNKKKNKRKRTTTTKTRENVTLSIEQCYAVYSVLLVATGLIAIFGFSAERALCASRDVFSANARGWLSFNVCSIRISCMSFWHWMWMVYMYI